MSTDSILYGAVAAVRANAVNLLLGYIVLRIFYLLWLHPLSDVPGPKIAALTDLWKTNAIINKRFSSILSEQHAKHGDVVRIGPNEVSIIAPDDVKTLYGHKSEYMKGPFYDAWSILGDSHFSDRNEITHSARRRSIATAYSIAYLTSLEQYCDTCTELLVRHIDKAVQSGSIIDVSKLIEWYTYDSVSGIGFGTYFGLLENGADTRNILPTMAEGTETLVIAGTLSNFGWILATRPVGWLNSLVFGDQGPNLFVNYGTKLVKERQALRESDPAAYEEKKDMLNRFMESIDVETSKPLDTLAVINNTLAIVVAGADTTRGAMVAFLRYVYSHPPTIARLRQELDEAVAAGNLSFPITYTQASHLEFLWACMKEAMRLYPATGMPLQRVVPAGGRVIGGRFYRAGTLVGMAAREVHVSKAYGKDAAEWRPDRWLEGDRNELEKFSLVFGQGSRVCLGKNISLMEMSKLLPTLVYHYDLHIKNPAQPWKVRESWFVTQYDFLCSVTKREHTA